MLRGKTLWFSNRKACFVDPLAPKICSPRPVRHAVGFQRNFLCQHDISGDKVTFGRKAPTKTRTAGAVELVDVHRIAVANPVSFSAMAAGDLKTASRFILRELLRR